VTIGSSPTRVVATTTQKRIELQDLAKDDQPDVTDLLAALRELSPSQRAAAYLFYVEDLPVREVARLMDTSVAAVKVHLHRGRGRLRELLGTEVRDA
jgi:RNA polymerase sigma factor (sigma-70 family)